MASVKANSSATRSSETGFSSSEKQQFLAAHNRIRAEVGVGEVAWDAGLAAKAQAYAEYLARTGKWKHSSTEPGWKDPYGENLACGKGMGYNVMSSLDWWYGEKEDYHRYFGVGGPINIRDSRFPSVGHYTQMVWRNTQRIGAGCAVYQTGPKKGWLVIVCKYDPQGNIHGRRPY